MRLQGISAQVHKLHVACAFMLLCQCALLVFCSCAFADEITVFFTGNELGQLQPCGCSGGQLERFVSC
jgi:hypothetical protein